MYTQLCAYQYLILEQQTFGRCDFCVLMCQVDVMKEAYAQGLETEEEEDSGGDQIKSRDVGHNIYILAHQVDKIPELYFSSDWVLQHFLPPVCLTLCRPRGPARLHFVSV